MHSSIVLLKITERILQGNGDKWRGYSVEYNYSIISLLSLSFPIPISSRYTKLRLVVLVVNSIELQAQFPAPYELRSCSGAIWLIHSMEAGMYEIVLMSLNSDSIIREYISAHNEVEARRKVEVPPEYVCIQVLPLTEELPF